MPMQPSHEDPLASLPQEVRAQLREAYLDEASPLVDDLESALLTLERTPDDEAVIAAAFRAAHTIKGSAASVGFRPIAAFTHEVENVLDALRGRQRRLEPSGLSALLSCVDMLRAFLVASRHDTPLPDSSGCLATLSAEFSLAGSGATGDRDGSHVAPCTPRAVTGATADLLDRLSEAQRLRLRNALLGAAGAYHIRFVLPEDAFRRGLDPVVLLAALGEEATLFGPTPLLDGLPPLDDLDPEKCYMGFQALAVSEQSASDLREVFEFCAADATVDIEPVDMAALLATAPRGALAVAEATDAERKRLGEILIEEGLVKADDIRRALDKQGARAEPANGDERASGDDGRIIRVKQARLDGLINLVGELVTARNAMLHLERFVDDEYADPRLSRRVKQTTTLVSKAVGQLQADVLSLRMVPVHTVFQRLPRVVRDVTVRQGKQVDLRFSGDSTELDKIVADALFEPLVHLVRNAVDHGVEAPEVRRAAGKSEGGHLDVGAWREGSEVVVEVRDDGAGVDRARVIAAAVEKGLIDPKRAAHLSDADTLDLLFASGLSTAREVSDISGRGVGLDAVRNGLARIGGSVHATSVPGQGTTMRLHLPLTLSVFRALIVRAGDNVFALPLDAVRATAAIDPAHCQRIHGWPVVSIRGNLAGLVSLADVLDVRGVGHGASNVQDHDWQVVVMEADGQWVGLVIDALDPPQEIMVKPVDAYLTAGGVVAGASVLGDGRVALVLEPAAIAAAALAYARQQERRSCGSAQGRE